MPRKDRTIAGTHAERWLREYHARRRPIAPGVVELKPSPEVRALAPLLSTGRTDVDAQIRNAIERGLLAGDVLDHRLNLVVAVAMAIAATSVAHARSLAAPALNQRRERAARLAAEVRSLCSEIGNEMYDIEEIADADGTAESASWERAVVDAGSTAARALEAYVAHVDAPNTDTALSGKSALRAEVDVWWRENAVDPDRRGAATIRDEIADALWQHIERASK